MALKMNLSSRSATAKPVAAPRRGMVVRAQAISNQDPQFREVGMAGSYAGPARVSTPFDDVKFAPIREAQVGAWPVHTRAFCLRTQSPSPITTHTESHTHRPHIPYLQHFHTGCLCCFLGEPRHDLSLLQGPGPLC